MGYSGLGAREHSSGARCRRGGITEDGQRASAADCGGSGVGLSAPAGRGQGPAGPPGGAQPGGAEHWRGRRNTGCTGDTGGCWPRGNASSRSSPPSGASFCGFIWAIGRAVEADVAPAARPGGVGAVGVQTYPPPPWQSRGHGQEDPRAGLAVRLRAKPAWKVRGCSRRITIMRSQPAKISVIDRREDPLDCHRGGGSSRTSFNSST